MFPELTPVLEALLISREDTDDTCLDVIERFVILSYDLASSLSKDDEVRQELFSRKARPLEKIPLKHPYYMLTEVSSKVVLYRARRCLSSLDGQVHLERDTSLKAIAECLITRRQSRKPRTLAISSCNLAVKLFVKDAVSASKPI